MGDAYSHVQNARAAYDQVAAEYAEHFRDEMEKKPFDRMMLRWLIEKVGDLGVICDMGCGSGEIAAFLHRHGAAVCGVDISEQMVEQARLHHPAIPFTQGDMLTLDAVPDAAYGGIAAFYSIVNIPPVLLGQVLAELHRTLCVNGVLLLTFHIGNEIRRLEQWWDKPVNLDFFFYEIEPVKTALQTAGFALTEVITREPYPDVEVETHRAYLFARRPEAKGYNALKF
jgi:ubiquinone/menaquinone biosynthesis C-methylase UbiE